MPSPISEYNLFKESYETLLKQLYGLLITMPEFLIVNGLKINFISFEQITQMLQNNQVERYIIDPILQPWANPPNKILTMFGNDGTTYLVKAKYDQASNQIYPPI